MFISHYIMLILLRTKLLIKSCHSSVLLTPPPPPSSPLQKKACDHQKKIVAYTSCLAKENTMDDSPFRQTFELGVFISTAEKSILNLVKL